MADLEWEQSLEKRPSRNGSSKEAKRWKLRGDSGVIFAPKGEYYWQE